MRRVVVTNNLTLDGVMQAPGRPDEDVRGGFDRGGWAIPDNDPVMGRVMGEGMAQPGALLLGRLLLLLALVLASLALSGCASTESENLSERPWNTPKSWETGLPSNMTEGR